MPNNQSAARRVYDILDLRQRILLELDIADLASFMRVERRGIEMVAGELYHTMSYVRVQSYMPGVTPRQKIYLAAVRRITAAAPKDMPAWLAKTCPPAIGMPQPKRYSSSFFKGTVLAIKSRCKGLRVIYFDKKCRPLDGEESESWVVNFDVTDHGQAPRGRIIIDRTFMLDEVPEDLIDASIPAAPDLFTIEVRLHLEILPFDPRFKSDRDWEESWLETFRKRRRFALAFHNIDFDALPITLGNITALLKQQIQAGRSHLLSYVGGEAIPPFTIPQFYSFASLASSSLTSLVLSAKRVPRQADAKPGISFAELPSVITIVRDHLVNLGSLTLTMGSGKTAEAVCGAMLNEDTLCNGGTIRDLSIRTVDFVDHATLFNTLRVVSRLCTPTAEVWIMPHDWAIVNGQFDEVVVMEEQSDYLQYLKSQTQARKRHLSTVDFPSLGITTLAQVAELEYDVDDKPLPLRKASPATPVN